jgi:Tol biopolymer transport system component
VRSRCVVIALLLSAFGSLAVRADSSQMVSGQILAPIGRQVGWLNFDAPRPRLLTGFQSPVIASDVAAVPGSSQAVVATSQGDLLTVDLSTSQLATLVARTDSGESLGAPVWWPNGAGLVFQRQDFSVPGVVYPGASSTSYPSRLETVEPDGSGRRLLIADGRQPGPAPDGSHLAFLRTSPEGVSLHVWSASEAVDQTLIAEGRFSDLAYPRYAPQGDRIAFAAPGALPYTGRAILMAALLPALAHGVPWDVWLVNVDGSAPRRLAELGADDGSIAWSPDGSQLFVYGGTGSFLVDAASGAVTPLPYITGYGATAWLPVP